MIKKLIPVILKAAIVAALAWFILSWVDIVSDNNSAAPEHSAYNIFVMMEGVKKN